MLGLLPGQREIDARDPIGICERRHRERDRHLERRRRRQAGPRRNVAVDQEIGSRERDAVALLERLHRTLDVVEPTSPVRRPRMVEVELFALRERFGKDPHLAVVSFGRCDDGAALDGHR
jgi:hypothetical protein